MKVKINSVNEFTLIPENDSEVALVNNYRNFETITCRVIQQDFHVIEKDFKDYAISLYFTE